MNLYQRILFRDPQLKSINFGDVEHALKTLGKTIPNPIVVVLLKVKDDAEPKRLVIIPKKNDIQSIINSIITDSDKYLENKNGYVFEIAIQFGK